MKKLLISLVAGLLAIVTCFSMTACGGLAYTPVNAQLDALTEVKSGTADVAVLDSTLARYNLEKNSYKDLQVLETDAFDFAQEHYAIGFRKDGNTAEYFNYALYKVQESGKMLAHAKTFKLDQQLVTMPEVAKPAAPAADSDFGKIIASGKFTLGITIFEPIAFLNAQHLIDGYDIQIAKECIAVLNAEYGIEIEFQHLEINWDEKENELNSDKIDCVWNGFTVTEERKAGFTFSNPYLINEQVLVIRKDDAEKYKDTSALKSAKFVAEAASAGESAIKTTITDVLKG